MPATIPGLLVAHLDLVARKLTRLAREVGIDTLSVASHERHAEMDRDTAFRCMRTYAVALGKLTEAAEMASYRETEKMSVREALQAAFAELEDK